MKLAIAIAVTGVAVVWMALELVVTRHDARRLFAELEELRSEQTRLDERWGRLLLERATWSTHGRVERIARNELDMIAPDVATVVVIEP